MTWEKFLTILSKGKSWIIAIIVIAIVVVPYIVIFFYLRGKGKTITIKPELSIVDIKNSDEVPTDLISDAVSKGKDILERLDILDAKVK